MSTKQSEVEAKRYIDSMLEIQRRTGPDPQVSRDRYERAVHKAAKSFDRLHRATRMAQSKS